MANEDYLKKARENGLKADTTLSEAELINTREEFTETWGDLMRIKKLIADEKLEALNAIDEKYKEELAQAESSYAFLLSLGR